MSTEITNAFILNSGNMRVIEKKNDEIKNILRNIQEQNLYKLINEKALKYFQEYKPQVDEKEQSFLNFINAHEFIYSEDFLNIMNSKDSYNKTLIEHIEEMIKTASKYDIETEYNLNVYVYFKTISKNKTLYIIRSPNKNVFTSFREINKKSNVISEYEYWDSCDKPTEFNHRQWNQRRKDWDMVFGKSNAYSEAMNATMIGIPYIREKKLFNYIASDLEIYTHLFIELMTIKFMQKEVDELREKGLKHSDSLIYRNATRKVREMIDDGSFLSYKKELEPHLLNQEQLLNKIIHEEIKYKKD